MGHCYPYMSYEEYIKTKNPQTNKIRIKLFREGIKEKKCERCGLTQWQGVSIPLELHHKNGNKRNNELSNLEILCPNCHALTETYRGKNIKNATVVE